MVPPFSGQVNPAVAESSNHRDHAGMSQIPLSQPDITEREIQAVTQVLRSGRLALGPQTQQFESLVAHRTGRTHGIAVNSGTSGLHLALLALGIGPGDEVLTTPFSFIASANCILMVGAKPVFVDICPRSLNLDPQKVEAAITDKTKAILAVEVFGNPTHMDQIERIARNREIPLIEDACEGLGGRLMDQRGGPGRPIGGFGRVSVFGFYPNKQITTGEGGMIVTDDNRVADLCRSMRNQGRATMNAGATGSWLAHERMGYNYRLSEIAAALGVVQMQRLDELLEKRRQVAGAYIQRLMGFPELVMPTLPDGNEAVSSWFVFVCRLNDQYSRTERDRIIEGIRRHEIGASNYFPCIHLQPFYREQFGHQPGQFPIAERMAERTIALPFHTALDHTTIDLVCQTLSLMLKRESLSRD